MNEIERMIGEFLAKDPSHPVMVEIIGEIPDETRRRIENIINGKNRSESESNCPYDCPGVKNESQTVTISLEAYAQMLRSHTQLETLRTAWQNSRGDLVWLLLRTMFGEEPRGDSDAK